MAPSIPSTRVRFDAVIFDLDGTVWDSAPGIVSCIEETLTEFGVHTPPSDDLRRHLGPPLNTMLADLGVPADQVDAARTFYRQRYRAHGEFECTVYPGVESLLSSLHNAGVPLAVATSKGDEVAVRMLQHFDLHRWFDTIHGAAMSGTGHGKDHLVADALLALASRRATTGAVMIGDRRYDITGGRTNGIASIGVEWGYAEPGELATAGADHIVATVDELAALLGEG